MHHGGHAFDLIRRFLAKGFDVRAAFMEVKQEGAKTEQLAAGVLVHLASGGPEQEARVRTELLTKYPTTEVER